MATSSVAKSVSEYQMDHGNVTQSRSSYLLSEDMMAESSVDHPMQLLSDNHKRLSSPSSFEQQSPGILGASVSHYALEQLREHDLSASSQTMEKQSEKKEEKSSHGDHQSAAWAHDNRPHRSDSAYLFDRD